MDDHERPHRSALLSFKFGGVALAGSLAMALVATFAPRAAQVAALGSCVSVLAGRNFFRTVVDASYKGVAFQVEVQIALHPDTGKLDAEFLSIDPTTGLPPNAGVGFLPPEDGTGRGQGFFTYTIRAKPGLPSGTKVANVAVITFDHGEPIATNQVDPHDPSRGTDLAKEAFITIDSAAPTSRVQPLPASVSSRGFPVRWAGQDGTGSGAGTFTIYVSTDGGPWARWLRDTGLRQATFTGVTGHWYAFYAVARDNVGNAEVKAPRVEAITRVVASRPPRVVGLIAESWHSQSTRLKITFDSDMNPASVRLLANYLLTDAGRDGRFGTPDDVRIALSSAAYDAATRTVTIATPVPLSTTKDYRLAILATNPSTGVRSSQGKLLHVHSNGTAGGTFLKLFRPKPGLARLLSRGMH